MALISLIVYLFALISPSFAPDCQVFSAGHSRPIDVIKASASAFLWPQFPSVIDARSSVYRSVSELNIVAIAEITWIRPSWSSLVRKWIE